jgi:hypothetical protein
MWWNLKFIRVLDGGWRGVGDVNRTTDEKLRQFIYEMQDA